MAQEAAVQEMAHSKLQGLWAHNQSFDCTDAKLGIHRFLIKPLIVNERHCGVAKRRFWISVKPE